MTARILRILWLAVAALCAALLTACRDGDEPHPAEEGTMSLSFRMMTAGTASRASASDDDHDEADSEFRYFEDGIDFNDLGIFLFASKESDAGDPGEEKLVLKMTQLSKAENVAVMGAPGLYTVNIDIMKAQLHAALGGLEIDPNATEKIVLRVLMLANSNSPGTNAQSSWNKITADNFKDVITQFEKEWSLFTMSYIYNSSDNTKPNYPGEDLTLLYKGRKSCCPMFGTCRYTVSQKALYDSSPTNRVQLGDIDMLRSLAKIRVVDNIPKESDGYPKITAAEVTGTQDKLRQLPDNALNYRNGRQVHVPNIAEPNNNQPNTFRLGVVPDSWTVSPGTSHTGAVRIGYIPEQLIGAVEGDSYPGRPVISVTVAFSATDSETYDIPMTGYKGQAFDFGEAILRNHIYTLSVSGIGDEEDNIKVRVTPWIPERQHIELQ